MKNKNIKTKPDISALKCIEMNGNTNILNIKKISENLYAKTGTGDKKEKMNKPKHKT
jgi:hypothetical protein